MNRVLDRTSNPEGFSLIVGDARVLLALTAAVVSLRKGETSLFAFSVWFISPVLILLSYAYKQTL